MATHEPSSQMLKTPRFVVNSLNADLQKGRLFRRTIDFANKRQKQHEERGSRGEEETRSNTRPSSTLDLPFSPSPILLCLLALFVTCTHAPAAGSRVIFNDEGIALVDGKPFFPIGVFTYSMDATVLAELREVHANTVLNGFQPNQLDLLHQHGLMAVCFTSDDWIKAAANHPATLAWYLTDEPEGRGVSAEGEKKRHDELKKRAPNHPIGLCHTAFEALTKFKDA